jgi:hypothetical protein
MKELIEIQKELKAPKNQYNSFGKYKYRSCEDILEALKPLLHKNKCTLVITDSVKEVCGIPYVEATITLSSEKGGVISNSACAGIDPNKKGMDKAQTFGTSSSYARKYALNGLFLIDDTKDSDSEEHQTEVKKKATPKPKQLLEITPEAYQKAVDALSSGKVTLEQIKSKYELSETREKALKELIKL